MYENTPPLRPKKNTQETGFILPPQTAQRQQAPNKPDDGLDPETIPVPEPDIQAILTVIRRRTRHFGNGEVERLDLHQTDIRRGNLGGAHLEEAYLSEAHLEGADLKKANLAGAILQGRAILYEYEAMKELTQEQINEAYGDENTVLPDHLDRPVHWLVG